jgi:type IV pilus assembly protein PilO
MAKIDIKNLPKPARIAVAIAPAVLFIALFGYLGIMPEMKRIGLLKQEIINQQNEIVKSQSIVDKLDTLRLENAKLKEVLAKLEEQLPEESEISPLLQQVSDLGIRAGLDIKLWNPAVHRRHPSGIVFEVPVSVRMSGSYHRLGYFFASLTMLDRIVNITDIKLGGPKPSGNEAVLDITFSAVTFTAIPEPKPGEEKK